MNSKRVRIIVRVGMADLVDISLARLEEDWAQSEDGWAKGSESEISVLKTYLHGMVPVDFIVKFMATSEGE